MFEAISGWLNLDLDLNHHQTLLHWVFWWKCLIWASSLTQPTPARIPELLLLLPVLSLGREAEEGVFFRLVGSCLALPAAFENWIYPDLENPCSPSFLLHLFPDFSEGFLEVLLSCCKWAGLRGIQREAIPNSCHVTSPLHGGSDPSSPAQNHISSHLFALWGQKNKNLTLLGD